MAKFCGKCGSPLNDTAVFCGGCGSPVPAAQAPAAQAPVQTTTVVANQPAQAFSPVPGYTPQNTPGNNSATIAGYVPGPVAGGPPAKKSNTLLKVIVALIVLIFVGGALALGGLWYAAQKIKEKARAAAAQSPGIRSVAGALGGLMQGGGDNNDSSTEFKGDPCRFLSKEEVSQAVGLPVVRAEADDNNCSYIAKGDPADAAAKHIASMVGGKGVDPKTQQLVQNLAGGFFSQQEAGDKSLSGQAAKGEVQVLMISYTVGNADMQMKLNRKTLSYVAGNAGTAASSGTGDLDGIGDEAYLAGGSMLIVRKADTIGRFLYNGCPCGTDNIKPLAKLAASRF